MLKAQIDGRGVLDGFGGCFCMGMGGKVCDFEGFVIEIDKFFST